MNDWVIFGSGGHARVIGDAIQVKKENLIHYFDDNTHSSFIKDVPVSIYAADVATAAKMIIGVGNNSIRRNIAQRVEHSFGTLVHPRAIIADEVIIGEGTVILAGAVIQTGAVIGKHVVIHANVTIDHDSIIGDYCSIYPGAYIGGGAKISAGVDILACTAVERLTILPSAPEELKGN